jgi:lysophospholipase L1-like esterase
MSPPSGDASPGIPRKKRLLPRLIVLGVLLVIAFFVWRNAAGPLLRQARVGTGPAGPTVPAEEFREPWSQRNVLLVGMGDSVTDGYGASKGFSYFDRLVANPANDAADMAGICLSAVFPNLESRNLAVSGSTSFDCLERQLPNLETQPEDVLGLVVLTTGGNDLIHNYGRSEPREGAMYGASLDQASPWIAGFEKRLNRILDGIETRFPGGCHIFLANIYDPTDGVGDLENAGMGLPAWRDGIRILEAHNEAIGRCAERRVNTHLVKMREAMLGHGIHFWDDDNPYHDEDDPTYWYFWNLEDPNDRGYDAIRRAFLLEMAKVAGAFRRVREIGDGRQRQGSGGVGDP